MFPYCEGGIEQLSSPAIHLTQTENKIPFEIILIALCSTHPSLSPHPVYVSQLPGIIIRVRPSWTWWVVVEVTAPAPYFAPKIWVKMSKLGANLDRSVWVGGCTIAPIWQKFVHFLHPISDGLSSAYKVQAWYSEMLWNIQISMFLLSTAREECVPLWLLDAFNKLEDGHCGMPA